MMMTEHPWYVYLSLEMIFMTIPYYGINFYDYLTRSKPWRREIQKRKSQGIELEDAAVTLQAFAHLFIRVSVWYFHIYYKTMTNLTSISVVSFILKIILSDGLGMLVHRYQHSKSGRIFNHLKHHQLRTPTLASAAYLSIGELLLSSHLGWIVMGFIPGSFWDHCLFLVVSSTLKRLCHSNYDHPWEYTRLYRWLKLVGSHEHHVHHLHPNKNFADLFVFWDQLFGTFLDPKEVDGIYNYENMKIK
jgi:sterol desaturase/sphingolipid hydroxylase (fatty acid hydroxylase superfamily)